jgi:hypothetical protein
MISQVTLYDMNKLVVIKDVLAIQYELKVMKILKLKVSSLEDLFFLFPNQRYKILVTNENLVLGPAKKKTMNFGLG